MVEDDHLSRAQPRHQHLLDLGFEAVGRHVRVDQHGRTDSHPGQTSQQRHVGTVVAGCTAIVTLATRRTRIPLYW